MCNGVKSGDEKAGEVIVQSDRGGSERARAVAAFGNDTEGERKPEK